MVHARSRLLLAAALLAGCGGDLRGTTAGPRSPSNDYPPPPAQTSDGEVVGADRVPPGDKLATGARLGTGLGAPEGSRDTGKGGAGRAGPAAAAPCPPGPSPGAPLGPGCQGTPAR